MRFDSTNAMRSLLGLTLLLLVLGAQAGAQELKPTSTPPPPPLHAVIALTGGPNPNPAVVGNTVRCRWSAGVEGEPAVHAECLTQKASYNWSVVSLLWTPPNGTAIEQSAASVTLESSNSTASTSWKADKAGTWTVTLRVDISYTGTECGGDWNGNASLGATVGVQDFVLHPSPADFTLVEDGAARVLTRKTRSDSYYSTNTTTRANRHAQTQDGQVTITAHLPPAGDGSTIYFRLVDPDDASPYEEDTDGGDNSGGAFISDQATATLCTINGNEVAAAEVVLILGSRLGDNYIVEASGDPAFPEAATQRTPILVCWNRAYVELDGMYTRGATVTEAEPIAAGDTTELRVDSTVHEDGTSLFTPRNGTTPGTSILIFTPNSFTVPGLGSQSTTITREVLAVTPTTVIVERIGVAVPKWSGVRLAGDASGYKAPMDLVETAYGKSTNGADGGAFIEFEWPIDGSRSVPHYAAFTSLQDWEEFSRAWFSNDANGAANNTFQMLTAARMADPEYNNLGGVTFDDLNISATFTRGLRNDGTTNVRRLLFTQKTAVHELGHQFPPLQEEGENGHVDEYIDAPNILPTTHPDHDNCIMSYNNAENRGSVKFDILCYEDLRRRTGAQ